MLKRSIVLIFVCLFVSQSVYGEPYPKHIYNGVKNSFDNPVWLAYAGGIYLLRSLDKPVRNRYTGKLLPKPIAKACDLYGNGVNFGISSAYIFSDGKMNDLNQEFINTNLQYHAEAFFVNLAFTMVLKETVKRWRPDGSNHRSFPSGHSSSSFVIAAMMQKMYGNKVGVPAFALACITGVQRIHGERHWLTDILTGALLGTLVGNGFGELLDEKNKKTPPVISFSISF
jgi:hypothetical protein